MRCNLICSIQEYNMHFPASRVLGKRKFNRTENIRQIPQSDPDFKRLYKRRNDAESINRALDDTLWLRRAHSVGHERQHLNLLTFALTVNGLALWRHQARHADPPLPLAA